MIGENRDARKTKAQLVEELADLRHQLMDREAALTKHEQVRIDLLTSRHFLQATLDALTAHIAILDASGTIISVNAAWRQFADENGYAAVNYGIGDNYLEVCDTAAGVDSEEASTVAQGLRKVLANDQERFYMEYPCHSPEEQRWFFFHATRFQERDSVRVVVAHENITERVQAEQELENHRNHLEELVAERTAELTTVYEQLKELDHLKDDFLNRVSHELRTPVTTIKLKHELLMRRHPELKESYLDSLNRSTNRLQYIIEELLYVTMMEQAEIEIQTESMNLNTLVKAYISDQETSASQRDLKISLTTDDNLPLIQADPRLIERVLSVLIDNAFNYTLAGGEIQISTFMSEAGQHVWVGVTVKDNGYGVPVEEQEKIFERFYRGKLVKEKLTTVPGTGVGLSIAREIITQHDGKLEVISDGVLGSGSLFTFCLPA